ncbi:hypothetical protein [Lactiplantibacillus daowaiensis]|uniref:Extracellular protein n=1 Tax=Lactiplantibacillus daowaiensis TaxID=2559918 RepID=A0ABW1RXG6_9LACO|nr:hypothetical protein [Lactiplantibacillus daowaiensis]
MRRFILGCLLIMLLGVTTASAKQFGTAAPKQTHTATVTALVQKLTPGKATAIRATTLIGTWQVAHQARTLKLRADGSYRETMGQVHTTGYWQLSGTRTITLTDAVGQHHLGQAYRHQLKFANQPAHWTKM